MDDEGIHIVPASRGSRRNKYILFIIIDFFLVPLIDVGFILQWHNFVPPPVQPGNNFGDFLNEMEVDPFVADLLHDPEENPHAGPLDFFTPSDNRLINLLARRVNHGPFQHQLIHERNFYLHAPQFLAGIF